MDIENNLKTRILISTILEELAERLESRKRDTYKPYNDRELSYAWGFNDAIEEAQQYLRDGAQSIRTE